jgi:hypothetical protein
MRPPQLKNLSNKKIEASCSKLSSMKASGSYNPHAKDLISIARVLLLIQAKPSMNNAPSLDSFAPL